ncbi:hypothetical protein PFISCL1PPCAC_2566, partial [Pristionchus fissidentatus]
LDLSYSTLDGNHSNTVHLPLSNAPTKMSPLTLSLGHFSSPIQIVITCKRGGVCNLEKFEMIDCEDDSPTHEVCPTASSFLCSSSS